MKKILLIVGILIYFSNIVIADPDFINEKDKKLDFIIDQDYININFVCFLSNTLVTIDIPIFSTNSFCTRLYLKNTSLEGVFGDNPVVGDKFGRIIDGSYYMCTYYVDGWGETNQNTVEPIVPKVGYIYQRVGAPFILSMYGTLLPENTNCSVYTYFNFKNKIGTRIIRPAKSDIYD
jgi:hypothetical protein